MATANLAEQLNIPLITFLHDRWDITSRDPYLQKIRKVLAVQTLQKSNYILSVTTALIKHYLHKVPKNGEVIYPIPSDNLTFSVDTINLRHIIYAGTIENHHFNLFNLILPVIAEKKWKFTVICNHEASLKSLSNKFQCFRVIKAFDTSSQALEYMRNNASVILVNYGINIQDNPFASQSFPSKFVEYCGLAKPILAVAPTDSPFHQFLIAQKWLAFEEHFTISGFKNLLEKFSNEEFYQKTLYQTKQLRTGAFNPIKIQERFEEVLMNLTK